MTWIVEVNPEQTVYFWNGGQGSDETGEMGESKSPADTGDVIMNINRGLRSS